MNTVDVSKDWTAKYVRNVYTQENYIELMKECTASGKKKKIEACWQGLAK